ncbi:hypothetical protein BH10PSE12_BH10PSE12_08750 [soil metagenome]
MRLKSCIALALGTALLAAAAADARPKPPSASTPPTITAAPVALMITGFDTDADLRVTRAEYDIGVKRAFDSVAGGGDSLSPIDLDHWGARWLGNSGALPGRLDFDTDGDDRVSRAEFSARFAAIFQTYDADSDGVITRGELLNIGTARFQTGRAAGGGPASGSGGGPGGPGGGSSAPPRR